MISKGPIQQKVDALVEMGAKDIRLTFREVCELRIELSERYSTDWVSSEVTHYEDVVAPAGYNHAGWYKGVPLFCEVKLRTRR